jgi:hypothetical protein
MQNIDSASVYPNRPRRGNAATCRTCGKPLTPKPGSRRQRYCGGRCKKRAYSDQNRKPATLPADRGRSVKNPQTYRFVGEGGRDD